MRSDRNIEDLRNNSLYKTQFKFIKNRNEFYNRFRKVIAHVEWPSIIFLAIFFNAQIK